MKASVVDLRYRMNEVLAALDRREEVTLTSHGKVRGTIIPVGAVRRMKTKSHPFFGMSRDEKATVSDVMSTLRGPRF